MAFPFSLQSPISNNGLHLTVIETIIAFCLIDSLFRANKLIWLISMKGSYSAKTMFFKSNRKGFYFGVIPDTPPIYTTVNEKCSNKLQSYDVNLHETILC